MTVRNALLTEKAPAKGGSDLRTQRLNKKNIIDIFLVQSSQGIQLPSLELRAELEPENGKKQRAGRYAAAQEVKLDQNSLPSDASSVRPLEVERLHQSRVEVTTATAQQRKTSNKLTPQPYLPTKRLRREALLEELRKSNPYEIKGPLTWPELPQKKKHKKKSYTHSEQSFALSDKSIFTPYTSAKNRKFSTFASTIKTFSSIVRSDPNQKLKVLTLHQFAELAGVSRSFSTASAMQLCFVERKKLPYLSAPLQLCSAAHYSKDSSVSPNTGQKNTSKTKLVAGTAKQKYIIKDGQVLLLRQPYGATGTYNWHSTGAALERGNIDHSSASASPLKKTGYSRAGQAKKISVLKRQSYLLLCSKTSKQNGSSEFFF